MIVTIFAIFTGILIIILYIPLFQPRFVLAWLTKRSPEVIFFVETDKPSIALTIDDGPNPDTTPKILETLARYNAHATFFLIGNRVVGNEHIVKQIINEGHEIGNHNIEDIPSIDLSETVFEQQLLETHSVLSKFSEIIKWFRPASGWYNQRMLAQLRQHHYKCVLGSIYPYDPHIPFVWFASLHILANASPGSIIILHDGPGRGYRTEQVLQRVLPKLYRQGFTVETLSNLFDTAKPPRGN